MPLQPLSICTAKTLLPLDHLNAAAAAVSLLNAICCFGQQQGANLPPRKNGFCSTTTALQWVSSKSAPPKFRPPCCHNRAMPLPLLSLHINSSSFLLNPPDSCLSCYLETRSCQGLSPQNSSCCNATSGLLCYKEAQFAAKRVWHFCHKGTTRTLSRNGYCNATGML